MRLIDGDALLSEYDRVHVGEPGNARKLIENAPTIEERKTEKWIKMSDADGYYYCCNKCGEELPRYMTELPSWDKPYPHKQSIDKTDFCPNCGAMMEGEDDG